MLLMILKIKITLYLYPFVIRCVFFYGSDPFKSLTLLWTPSTLHVVLFYKGWRDFVRYKFIFHIWSVELRREICALVEVRNHAIRPVYCHPVLHVSAVEKEIYNPDSTAHMEANLSRRTLSRINCNGLFVVRCFSLLKTIVKADDGEKVDFWENDWFEAQNRAKDYTNHVSPDM